MLTCHVANKICHSDQQHRGGTEVGGVIAGWSDEFSFIQDLRFDVWGNWWRYKYWRISCFSFDFPLSIFPSFIALCELLSIFFLNTSWRPWGIAVCRCCDRGTILLSLLFVFCICIRAVIRRISVCSQIILNSTVELAFLIYVCQQTKTQSILTDNSELNWDQQAVHEGNKRCGMSPTNTQTD